MATPKTARRMPTLFVGHGSPMNAIEDNPWSRGFAALPGLLPRPAAILSISAHWYVDGTLVTADDRPATIHDFHGFPPELSAIEYPAPGDRALAQRVRGLIGAGRCEPSLDWGLDHGTWSVLVKAFPAADIPVVQLSIDRRLAPREHFELARSLRDLRRDGVLILGSGNITHNLGDAFRRWQTGDLDTPDWARRVDRLAAEAVLAHDTQRLLGAWPDTADGRMAHPTGDHWLPLLYAYGASEADDAAGFPIEGFDGGSLSMRTVLFG